MTKHKDYDTAGANRIVTDFTLALGGVEPDYAEKYRPDGDFILFQFAYPSNRFYSVLENINNSLSPDDPWRDHMSIVARTKKPSNTLKLPEIELLQSELSQSLTVDQNTFGDDFLSRYTKSVTNHERSIVGKANFIVYGRRGAGKSSLLAYAMHHLKRQEMPYCWVAMQTYNGRDDVQALCSILAEVIAEARKYVNTSKAREEFNDLFATLQRLGEVSNDSADEQHLTRLLPRMKLTLRHVAEKDRPLTIFLDDLHCLGEALQPKFLGMLYSLCRDNNIYIKASGNEQFTRIWDAKKRYGLEPPHDVQILRLDYNLTMPDLSKEHIRGILDAHAQYCGLPSVSYIANEDVISRLVLVAAAVPRDALSLFSQAITKSLVKGQKSVSVTSVNMAASETLEEKVRDMERDILQGKEEVDNMLERLKHFCITDQRKNAFLIKIDNTNREYLLMQKLIALRLVHVLHEGITPHKAGIRYMALMLDFGFYVGIRAAKSVELFPGTPRSLPAKELRKLPVLPPNLLEG